MKNKTPLIFSGIFVLLLVMYYFTSYNPPEETKGAKPIFDQTKQMNFDKIEFSSVKRGPLTIENVNGVWTITSPFKYKASDYSINDFFTTLYATYNDGIISSSPSSHESYAVNDELGTSFKLYSAGEVVLDYVVGTYSTDMLHTYVRENGSDDVHIWRDLFCQFAIKTADEWRDKSVYSFNPDDVVSITAEKPTGMTTLDENEEGIWTYTENGKDLPLEQDRIQKFITLISTLICDGFADAQDIGRVGSVEPDTKVTFNVRNGDSHTYYIWTPGEGDPEIYLMKKESGEMIFRFFAFRGQQLAIDTTKWFE